MGYGGTSAQELAVIHIKREHYTCQHGARFASPAKIQRIVGWLAKPGGRAQVTNMTTSAQAQSVLRFSLSTHIQGQRCVKQKPMNFKFEAWIIVTYEGGRRFMQHFLEGREFVLKLRPISTS